MNESELFRGSKAPYLADLQVIQNSTGVLGVIEAAKHCGFDFKRFYFLTDLAKDAHRGGHAHKKLQQCIILLRGSATIELKSRGQRYEHILDSYGVALIVPPGHWREIGQFSSDALLAVLASEPYDETDYIRNYEEFLRWEMPHRIVSVPYLDLTRYLSCIGKEIENAIASVVKSGRYIGGDAVEKFEIAFSRTCAVAHGIGVANGLDALELILRSSEIQPGDQIILPANTFIATALAVSAVGATPILCDVEPDTGLIDPKCVEAAITPRTRAIIAVHLFGQPADMDPLKTISNKHSIYLIEDACQAHGALYKGKPCGGLADAAAFSFYPTKNMGALGDAGLVTTNNRAFAGLVSRLANYGSSTKYHHEIQGVNSRLDPIQAAVLMVKLRYLEAWNERRRNIAARYREGLVDIDGLALLSTRDWSQPVWHVFPVFAVDNRRDSLIAAMNQAGIGTNIHYPVPVHLQKCYAAQGWAIGDFPESERIARQTVSLPLDPMHSNDEIDYVIEAIRRFYSFDPLRKRAFANNVGWV